MIRSIARGSAAHISSLVVALFLLPVCAADMDVNAVAGSLLIDGVPAPAGTTLTLIDSEGFSQETFVDGEYVPPFLAGMGRFDTGDVPFLETGEEVTIEVEGVAGFFQVKLLAGTTKLSLVAISKPNEGGGEGEAESEKTKMNRSMEELASLSSVLGTIVGNDRENAREAGLGSELIESTLTLEEHVLSRWDSVNSMISERLVDIFVLVNEGVSMIAMVLTLAEEFILNPFVLVGLFVLCLIGGMVILGFNRMMHKIERQEKKKQVVVERVRPFWDQCVP
jgi:hypothetical protein